MVQTRDLFVHFSPYPAYCWVPFLGSFIFLALGGFISRLLFSMSNRFFEWNAFDFLFQDQPIVPQNQPLRLHSESATAMVVGKSDVDIYEMSNATFCNSCLHSSLSREGKHSKHHQVGLTYLNAVGVFYVQMAIIIFKSVSNRALIK